VVIPIWAIVQDTVVLCQERLASRSIAVDGDASTSNQLVKCAPIAATQILLNLIANSVDALEQCEEKLISLNVEESGGCIHLIVQDSGAGIPNEIAEKVMQPFFTTKEVGKGTGLGLSISKGLAEKFGGQLSLTKSPSGARFALRFPGRESPAATRESA